MGWGFFKNLFIFGGLCLKNHVCVVYKAQGTYGRTENNHTLRANMQIYNLRKMLVSTLRDSVTRLFFIYIFRTGQHCKWIIMKSIWTTGHVPWQCHAISQFTIRNLPYRKDRMQKVNAIESQDFQSCKSHSQSAFSSPSGETSEAPFLDVSTVCHDLQTGV